MAAFSLEGAFMSILFDKIDKKRTAERVSDFLTDDLHRLLLRCGRSRFELSSPSLDLAPSHGSGGNTMEKKLIDGIDAQEEVNVIYKAAHSLRGASKKIIIGLYFSSKPVWQVKESVQYEKTKYYDLRDQALCDFADTFDRWQQYLKYSPKIDLHVYADSKSKE